MKAHYLGCGAVRALPLSVQAIASASVIHAVITRLEQSEFVHARAASNPPFVPHAWLDVSENRDLVTKQAFALIMLLFTLAGFGPPARPRVLTIPTG